MDEEKLDRAPRRKGRPKKEVCDETLPELTPKQYAYVQARLSGKNKSDSYREAYDCANSTNESIWVNSSKLESNTKVALWLATARREQLSKANYTLESYLQQLDEVRTLSLEAGNYGAAVQATHYLGKAAGHNTDGGEIGQKIGIEAAILQLARLVGREVALALAQERLGYTADEAYRILGITKTDGVEVARLERVQ